MICYHLLFLIAFLYTSSAFYLSKDYSIQELNSTKGRDFVYEAANWYAVDSAYNGPIWSECGDRFVIGSYTSLAQQYQRTYTNLKSHSMVYYTYTVYNIDCDDPGRCGAEYVTIVDTESNNYYVNAYINTKSNEHSVCGRPSSDQVGVRVFGRIPHSAPSLQIVISSSSVYRPVQLVAFRDIRITLVKSSDDTPIVNDVCITMPPSLTSYDSSYTCSCEEGYYLGSKGKCKKCNSQCSSCFGPSPSQCYWCADGSEWNGKRCKSKPTFLTLVRLLQPTRYLDIYLPPRLRSFLDRPASNLFPINSETPMGDPMRRKFGIYSLPEMFAEYNMHSNFLVNFWGEIITMLCVVAVAVPFYLCYVVKAQKMTKTMKTLVKEIVRLLKWNFLLLLIAFNIDYIILYASLQLHGIGPKVDSIFGVIVCIICLLMILSFFIGVFYVVRLITTSVRYEGSAVKNRKTYAGYYVLFGGYRQTYKITKFFYVLYMIRVALPSLIAVVLYPFPVAQAALYMLINMAILFVIVYTKPIVRKINQVQLTIQETLALVINISVLILASHDTDEWRESSSTIAIGDLVIVVNTFMNLVTTIFLVVKLFMETRKVWRMRKITSYLKKGAWIRLFGVYIQQGAFGFEEVIKEKILFDKETRKVAMGFPAPTPAKRIVEVRDPNFVNSDSLSNPPLYHASIMRRRGSLTNSQPNESPSLFPNQSPTLYSSQSPGLLSNQNPGLYPSQSPGLLSSQSPGLFPSQSPGLLPMLSPGPFPSQSPGLFSSQSPGLFPSQNSGVSPSQSQSPGLLQNQSPGLSPGISPGFSPNVSPGSNNLMASPLKEPRGAMFNENEPMAPATNNFFVKAGFSISPVEISQPELEPAKLEPAKPEPAKPEAKAQPQEVQNPNQGRAVRAKRRNVHTNEAQSPTSPAPLLAQKTEEASSPLTPFSAITVNPVSSLPPMTTVTSDIPEPPVNSFAPTSPVNDGNLHQSPLSSRSKKKSYSIVRETEDSSPTNLTKPRLPKLDPLPSINRQSTLGSADNGSTFPILTMKHDLLKKKIEKQSTQNPPLLMEEASSRSQNNSSSAGKSTII